MKSVRRDAALRRGTLPRRAAMTGRGPVTLLVMGAVAGVLGACSGGGETHNAVPQQWIGDQYAVNPSPIGYRDAADGPAEVADEIDGRATAVARSSGGRTVYLRYRDDIVAVAPLGSGSLIEIADYRTGYQRWQTSLPSSWPHPDSDNFRGGGPGSGK
ncbi:DUF4247 domain-containing protein [Streptomyces sp. NPDC004610]|uniref:DUF4247 domain-containing protein n=1 Tax=unclassified Streptomyces TaxID=2593676 RepID=UPI0033B58ACC